MIKKIDEYLVVDRGLYIFRFWLHLAGGLIFDSEDSGVRTQQQPVVPPPPPAPAWPVLQHPQSEQPSTTANIATTVSHQAEINSNETEQHTTITITAASQPVSSLYRMENKKY